MIDRRHHGPPRFVRRMGCAFAALIVFSAIAASTLVSLLSRTPQRRFAIVVVALVVMAVLFGAFAAAIRRVARVFGEQQRLRRQLMADVAHELRTPLAILQGRIEGLIDGVYPRDDARLAELLAETNHLSRLVEDVRTLANAEAGALDLRKESVDVAELIRETAASFGAPIAVEAPESLPSIQADPVRIREVLLNLLSNAVQYAPEGRISIHAVGRPREVVIRVRDDGPGIPAEELPHVFERFRKGRHSRGSGLGLAIAQKLVLAHGGTIEVQSAEGAGEVQSAEGAGEVQGAEGAGTTVTVKLPE
jgi:two-component system sensor histidine kinase BaeS